MHKLNSMLLGLLFILSLACKHQETASTAAGAQEEEELRDQDLPKGINDSMFEEEFSEPIHPDEAERYATRSLLMSTKQPSEQTLVICQSDIASSAAKVQNASQVEPVAKELLHIIGKNFDAYHWCFYQMMDRAEAKLETSSDLLREGGPEFVKKMKELLILSLALDMEDGNNVYRSYLKIRYAQINHDYFGSRLRNIYGRKDVDGQKQRPAGKFHEP